LAADFITKFLDSLPALLGENSRKKIGRLAIWLYNKTRSKLFARILYYTLDDHVTSELNTIHDKCVKKFMHVYNDLVINKECFNEGLRLLGLLSNIIVFTSDLLGLKDDKKIFYELIHKLYVDKGKTLKRVLDVAGLVGLALLSKNLGYKKFRWAEKKLRDIVKKRYDLTPQLAEARLVIGERSTILYEHTCAANCIRLLDRTAPVNVSTSGLSREEKEIVKLCVRLRRVLFKAF